MTSYDIRVEELDASSPIAAHPLNTKVRLKRHQLTLLHRCLQFENSSLPLNQFPSLAGMVRSPDDKIRTQVGVLGDKVGSGKSYVILSLVLCNAQRTSEPVIRTYGFNKIVIWQHDTSRTIKTNLLVIPHNLVGQWEDYIKLFSDQIKYLMITKSRIVEQLYSDTPTAIDLSQYDLIVVTSTFYNKVAHLLESKSVKLYRAIFDEVDNMNIPGCVPVETEFLWFVTASYGNLLYPRGYHRWDIQTRRHIQCAAGLKNSGFVKNLFTELYSMVSTDYIRVLVVKNKDEYIQESIHLPNIENFYVQCRTPNTISVLNGLVDKNIIDCLNAGDISSAMQFVNINNRKTEDNIITLLIEKYTKQIHNIKVRIEYTKHYEYDSEAEKQAELDRLIKKDEELNNKIISIRNRIHESNLCTICYDIIENKSVVPCCSNAFCFKCISMWLCRSPMCPLCKTNTMMSNVLVVDSASTSSTAGTSEAAESDHSGNIHFSNDKSKNLENILRKLPQGAKVLLFSSYENSFGTVLPVLHTLNMNFASLKGNGNQIKTIIDQYKTGDLNVLCVNTRSYGSGLNLENTTDVILLHKFDNEIEKQVIGRAHRYGRRDALRVWYLLHENEMMDIDNTSGTVVTQNLI